ncbi:hypothetical protein [Streptomyces sp.]|uniref:hypothetical protein n=1 Tax=Streptomyces sp. TaxID=1931 RepID=UPI002F95B557
MSVIDVFCNGCKQVHPHASGEGRIVCTGCGLVSEADDSLLIAALNFASSLPVQDMRFCPWCRETKPVGHDCLAGAVGCTTNPPEGPACGACSGCTGTQSVDLARRAEFEHGSPSDLHHP